MTEYLKLSQAHIGQKIAPKMAARFPGGQCPLFGVMTTLPHIRGVQALIIGPAVCTYNVKLALGIRAHTSNPLQDIFFLVTIDQEDIVFGIGSKVQRAIVDMDKIHTPDVLFIVSTCVPEITGEDLDAIIDELKNRVHAQLVVIHTEHVSGSDLSVGVERSLAALAEIMAPADQREDTVNLLGYYYSGAKDTELIGLLSSKSIRVHAVLPAGASLSITENAALAKINLVIDHRALPLARRMKEMLGTSYLYCPRPYALDDVRIWYHRIATALGIDLSADTDSLATKAKSEMASLQAVLAGRSFGLRGVPGRPLAVAKFLVELGMRPLFIHTGCIIEQDKQEIQFILEKGFDPILVGGEDSMEIDCLLWSSRPDYLIAYNFRDIQPASRWGIKVGSIEPASAKLGYECSLEAARILASVETAHDILFYKNQFFDAIEKG